jgi:hypothetical protein
VQHVSCLAVSKLCTGVELHRESFGSSGTCDLVVRAMKEFPASHKVQAAAAEAAGALAAGSEENAARSVSRGSMPHPSRRWWNES